MKSPFDEHPEFITHDHRAHRNFLPTIKQVEEEKHEVLLPAELIKDKTILDLGACIGLTGQWCLYHGAKSYTGVEIQEEYVDIATKLLSHHGDKANIVQSEILEYLDKTIEDGIKFDIVIVSGLLYMFMDYYSFLQKCCNVCDEFLAINSNYPKPFYDLDDKTQILLRGLPFIYIHVEQHINVAFADGSVIGDGCKLTPGALRKILNLMGFGAHSDVLDVPVDGMLNDYRNDETGLAQRFLVRYYKTTDAQKATLQEDFQQLIKTKDTTKVRKW